jgi:hypothetical protein
VGVLMFFVQLEILEQASCNDVIYATDEATEKKTG